VPQPTTTSRLRCRERVRRGTSLSPSNMLGLLLNRTPARSDIGTSSDSFSWRRMIGRRRKQFWNTVQGSVRKGRATKDYLRPPNGDAPGTPNGKIEGLPPTDVPFAPVPESPSTLLSRDATSIPEAASLLKPLPDHPPPSRRELFEQALQLRMTQLALTEHAEGSEGAVEKWLEVFSWVATQKEGNTTGTSLSSIDGSSFLTTSAFSEVLFRQHTPIWGSRLNIEPDDIRSA
jgi:hypothetical protein